MNSTTTWKNIPNDIQYIILDKMTYIETIKYMIASVRDEANIDIHNLDFNKVYNISNIYKKVVKFKTTESPLLVEVEGTDNYLKIDLKKNQNQISLLCDIKGNNLEFNILSINNNFSQSSNNTKYDELDNKELKSALEKTKDLISILYKLFPQIINNLFSQTFINSLKKSDVGIKLIGGTRKKEMTKTMCKYTDSKGKQYVIYKKGGKSYIKKKSKSTGKFTYMRVPTP